MNSIHEYQGRDYRVAIGEDLKIHFWYRDRKASAFLPFTKADTVNETDGQFSENSDLEDLCALSVEARGEGTFVFTSKSSLWDRKEYVLECDEAGFTYRARIAGRGRVGKVSYFMYGHTLPEEDGRVREEGSDYHFCGYYVPYPTEHQHKNASESFRSFYELLIPPPYVFSFRIDGIADGRFGLGLLAKEGEYNFTHYDYTRTGYGKKSMFYLSTDLEGHTYVDGDFEFPAIRAFFGENDLDVISRWAEYNYDSGLCRRREWGEVPRWWYGPIVCGWNEQEVQIEGTWSQKGMASQKVYTKIAGMIEEKNIRPTMLIIDDKWQRTYGDCLPDEERWPDMRAFTDEMHRRGIHTLLWFRMWGGEGLPEDEVMDGFGTPYKGGPVELDYAPYADPTNEKYRAHLKQILYKLLSSDEGCMNVDGFKLDYTLVMPYGKRAKSAGGQYGAELTKQLYKLIYETAKEIKPDCLINGSPAHPYFAEYCDMARLHDYDWAQRNEAEQMRERASIFRATMPGVLIDCDSVNFADREDAMHYYKEMPSIGAPDIYQFSNDWVFRLDSADWEVITKVFNDYSDEMDRLHGKDATCGSDAQ